MSASRAASASAIALTGTATSATPSSLRKVRMIKCYTNALQEGCNVHSGHGTKVSVDVDGVAVPGDWPELLKCRIFSVLFMRRENAKSSQRAM